MALADSLPDGAHVALDTNTIIYFVEQHPEFRPIVRPVFERVQSGRLIGHISVMSLMEVLVLPLRMGNSALADQYREIIRTTPSIRLHEITGAIAERAATLRALYRLTPPDAIVVTTALEAGCSHLARTTAGFALSLASKFS